MIGYMKNYVVKHRNRFVWGGILIGGGIFAVRFAQRKLLEYQMHSAKEFIEKTRRTQHYEATERTCSLVISNLAPNLTEQIMKTFDTDIILEKLRKKPENKAELWNELKVVSFARLATLVYASSMLVIALRIEMNLLGGYLYKANVPEQTQNAKHGDSTTPFLSTDLQQIYLGEIQYFFEKGIAQLSNAVLEVTRKLLKNYKLNKALKLGDIEQIFWSIQMSLNSIPDNPNSKMQRYFFTADTEARNVRNPIVQQLLDETVDVMDTDEVALLAANNVSRGFSIVFDHLGEYLMDVLESTNKKRHTMASGSGNAASSEADIIPNASTIEISLAKMIPIVNGLTTKPFNMATSPPNLATALVTMYMLADKVKILGVNVYEVFSV